MSTIQHQHLGKGFTVVELVITISVIGILATISIVSYNGIQKRAQDASVQSDLESITGHLEGGRVRSVPQNFASTEPALDALNISVAKGSYDTSIAYNMIYCVLTTGPDAYQAFTLVAKSKSGNIFMFTQDGAKTHSLTQSDLTAGLCTTLGQTSISNGMTTGGVWKPWAHG